MLDAWQFQDLDLAIIEFNELIRFAPSGPSIAEHSTCPVVGREVPAPKRGRQEPKAELARVKGC